MPEGPEVKKTVDYLLKYKNYTINKITINSGRYTKKNFKMQDKLLDDLPLKIFDVKCKGKFIYFKLSNDMYIFNTLGMSGYWTNNTIKHNNITLHISKNKTKKEIFFNDVRNFGTIMYQTKKDLDNKLKCLGVDIIEDYNNIEMFKNRLERKRDDAMIATALMDQKVTAGCGNYIRAEVLYHSKISPYRKIRDLSKENIKDLWYYLTRIAWIFYDADNAIIKGLLSKKDIIYKTYIDSNKYNNNGYYTNFVVYMMDKDSYGNIIIREKIGDRTIHWVPKIQK